MSIQQQMSVIIANTTNSGYVMYGTEFFSKADTQLINNSLIFYGTHSSLVHSQEQLKMAKFTK